MSIRIIISLPLRFLVAFRAMGTNISRLLERLNAAGIGLEGSFLNIGAPRRPRPSAAPKQQQEVADAMGA